MHACVCVCVTEHAEARGQFAGVCSLHHVCQAIQCRSSDLAAGTFTYQAISPSTFLESLHLIPPKKLFIKNSGRHCPKWNEQLFLLGKEEVEVRSSPHQLALEHKHTPADAKNSVLCVHLWQLQMCHVEFDIIANFSNLAMIQLMWFSWLFHQQRLKQT